MATTSAYIAEFAKFFEPHASLDRLKQTAYNGGLANSKFRSVVWKILLNCLPVDKSLWIETVQNSRRLYSQLRHMVVIDPRRTDVDPTVANPLSQIDDNPWLQHFADNELRASIIQDVQRTFPELQYFQQQSTRNLMVDILFVYARHHPHIMYKQGMHEILGPLIFVLHFDLEAFAHCSEQSNWPDEQRQLLSVLFSANFLEHDSYTLFAQIMRIIEPWYCSSEELHEKSDNGSIDDDNDMTPFVRPQDTNTNASQVVAKLNRIGDKLLAHADPPLYQHLENLQIPPQIYGIRWLRLLFGREFNIHDLLQIWDAIFADGQPFTLVDCIFIAMLTTIKPLLLQADYTGCLNYLMRYPPIVDVRPVIQQSLYLRNPRKFGPPIESACPRMANYTHITQQGRPHPNLIRDDLPSGRDSIMTSNGTSPSQVSRKFVDSFLLNAKLPTNMRQAATYIHNASANTRVEKTLRRVDAAVSQLATTQAASDAELHSMQIQLEQLQRRCQTQHEIIRDAAQRLTHLVESRPVATSYEEDLCYLRKHVLKIAKSLQQPENQSEPTNPRPSQINIDLRAPPDPIWTPMPKEVRLEKENELQEIN